MKLFLTSAGLPKETSKYFLELLGKDPRETTVAFIPTAADPEEDKWFVDKALDQMKVLKIKEIEVIDLKQEDKESLRAKLSRHDVIYVNGGNTFYLLKYVRESGFDDVTKELLKQGKLYVGSSAGSYLAGPTIMQAYWGNADRNIVKIKDLEGMNLVPFLIFAHYEENDSDVVRTESRKINYKTIPLTDHQAIVVEDSKWEIVGEGDKVIFNEDKS